MNKKQLTIAWVLLFFLLGGCSKHLSLTKVQQEAIEKLVAEEGTMGIPPNIIEVDLNKDGKKEDIVICERPPHHSGVKVVKFNGDKAEVIFEHFSNTAETQFKIINNIPTLIFEESDYTPDYATGKRYKEIYQWDGKTFKLQSEK